MELQHLRPPGTAGALEGLLLQHAEQFGLKPGVQLACFVEQRRPPAAILAFADAFRVMAVLFVTVAPLMFLMRRAPKSGQPGAAAACIECSKYRKSKGLCAGPTLASGLRTD